MRLLILLIVAVALSRAQNTPWSPSQSGSSIAAAEINSKPAVQYGTGAPTTQKGTAGLDFYIETGTAALYFCTVTGNPCGNWAIVSGSLPANCSGSGSPLTCTSFNAGGASPTKNGALILNGFTSGGIAISVANVAGTATTLIWPSTGATTSQVLTDNGSVTCPTDLPSGAPATCRALIWSTPSAGGGAYAASFSSGAVAMTGSYVTVGSISNVPALAAGSCYNMRGSSIATQAHQVEIFVDSTMIANPVNVGSAGYGGVWEGQYCNNPGVQNAQTISYYLAGYVTPGANIGLGSVNGDYTYITPTAVDWSTSHTITVKITAASGTATMRSFMIGP